MSLLRLAVAGLVGSVLWAAVALYGGLAREAWTPTRRFASTA